ncbi:MAG: S41 family peptidase [Candidatus Moraniibacteriota bacterium]
MTEANEPTEVVAIKDQGHQLFKRAFIVLFAMFLFGLAYFGGYEQGRAVSTEASEAVLPPDEAIILNKKSQDATIDFSLFWKVWEVLKDKYVDKSKLDARELFYGAIDGMLAATGDPYTTFFSPKENQEFNEDISGTFEGIGAEMGMKDDIITIIAPLEGTPAEKAGLLSGDKIVKIDGIVSSNYSLDEAVKHIRGQKGTEVKLTIFRVGEEETREVVVRRDTILVKSVRFEMKEDGIAYIRVSRFGEDTNALFKDATKQALAQKASGMIIDLRNNPGGFLETAVSMSSLMLPAGKVVVMEEDGEGKRTELKARGGDILSALPTVVLINEGSASASEILAGALRENRDNVTLIGKKSYGKGSVQELVSVSKDTAVKITVARWLTPLGKQIHNVGISPDIEVSISPDDRENKRDPQLDKALEELKKK